MTERNVPIQSLIDHIKTAVDIDPWAKKMAEELLKEQEQDRIEIAHEMVSNSILMYQGKEIVRCKDCKKRNSWECWQYFFGRIKIPDDWFCADGERSS